MKPGSTEPLETAPWPRVDFAAFGPVETQPLSRVQQITSAVLSRNWVRIPHVTHHDEADISALDAARKALAERTGRKITPLAYLMKAAVEALAAFPRFNASIDEDANCLVLKQYFHIGFAVDTPAGILVPVIRDADRKPLADIAAEIAELSEAARGKGLSLDRMEGGCFTVSSLGSVGGTAFTPIINAPEVAIMGVTRAYDKPVRVNDALEWRTVLPLSLSYDHRVINGADAARFCLRFAEALQQPEQWT